jgi:hypothetical protein
MKNSELLFVFVIIGIGLLFLVNYLSTRRENFSPLGTMGKYKDGVFQCLSSCEREDTSKRLGNNNLACGEWCWHQYGQIATDNVIEASKEGVPDDAVPRFPITPAQKCERTCKGDDFCRDRCNCHSEVIKRCEVECAYGNPLEHSGTCIDKCVKVLSPNCQSLSWTWKKV